METVKIKTKKGRIVTLSITEQTQTHMIGKDKFGTPTIVPIENIDSMFPLEKKE
jgi:sporulation protein YlmC with PRC-barrel domain